MQTRHRFGIAIAVRTALMAASSVAAVQAQESQPPQEQLQEITVEAKKYLPNDQTIATGLRMKLLETPQSVSVVSKEMLKEFDASSAYDAANMIPGVSQGAQAFGEQLLLVRGQTPEARVDGALIMQSSTSQNWLDAYALDRIEVVRGPATVLYGVTGEFGGEINQVLKKPTSDFRANFGFKSGDFMRRRLEGDVSGPVPGTDGHLKIRILGAYSNSGIPQHLVVPANNVNKMLSAAVTYDLNPNAQASVYFYQQDRHFDPTDGCPMAQTADGTLYIPTSIPTDHWYCNDPYESRGSWRVQFALASLTYALTDDWHLDAKVAHSMVTRTSDYAFGFGPAGANGLPSTDVALYSYKDREDQHVVTSDLSLNGKFDLFNRTQQFLAAVEYQRLPYSRDHYATFGLGVFNMFEDGGLGTLADGSRIPPIPSPEYVGVALDDTKEARGSLQLLLTPLERLRLLIGALADHIDETAGTQPVTGTATSASLSQTNVVSRAAITYDLVREKGPLLSHANAYFNYSQGVSPNVGVFDSNGNPLTAPQQENSYEVGLKTEWLGGRLNAYLAAYDSSVTNRPVTNYTGVGATGGFFSSVLGGQDTYEGADFELIGEIVPGWNVEFNYAYIRALLDSLLLHTQLAVASVPRQQAGVVTSYEFLRGPLRGLNLGVALVTQVHSPLIDNDSAIFGGHYDPSNQLFMNFTKVDFRASYAGFSGRLQGFEISANLYNAFNARTFYSLSQTPDFSNTVSPPRTLTLGVSYSFGR